MMEEIWKDIEECEGYQVSNLGRIRSVDRVVHVGNRWGGVNARRYKGKLITTFAYPNGYMAFVYKKEGKVFKNFLIHRLVAQAFIPNPDNLPQINHKNEQRDDNRVDNLEWCTCVYNIMYNNRSKRVAIANGKPIEQLSMDGHLIREFPSIREAARFVIGDMKSIRMCCKKDTMTHYYKGYRWKFKE
jgi:hypothetical protein